jgi:hypothetical protein
MKKKKQQKRIIFLTLTCLGVFLIGVCLLFLFYPHTKAYHSRLLKITIDYPTKFDLEEKFGELTLKSTEGKIIINRIGTNNNSLIYGSTDQKVIINGMEAKISNLTYADDQNALETNHKMYQFLEKNAVYSFSTNTVVLYPDLDAIVQSLRFDP